MTLILQPGVLAPFTLCPNGAASQSPGLACFSPTLGRDKYHHNPERVASGRNPFRVVRQNAFIPGLTAKSSGQPWALRRNAFGVERSADDGISWPLSQCHYRSQNESCPQCQLCPGVSLEPDALRLRAPKRGRVSGFVRADARRRNAAVARAKPRKKPSASTSKKRTDNLSRVQQLGGPNVI